MTAADRAELRDLARREAAKAPPLTADQVAELRRIFAPNGDGPAVGTGPSVETSAVAGAKGGRHGRV